MAQPLSILLVENSPNDALLIEHTLVRSDAAIECRVVETLAALASVFDTVRWDCVLSDFDLGSCDAFDVIETVRRYDQDVPIVVVTGAITEEQAVAMLRSGAQNYVMKDNLIRLGSVVHREVAGTVQRRARRQAEEALRSSEARYRAVMEDLLEYLVRWTPDGTLQYTSPSFASDFGADTERAQWGQYSGFVQEGHAISPAELCSTLSPGQPVVTRRAKLNTSDKGEVWLEWSHRGIFDPAGELVEIQSLGRDITEQQRAFEAERQRHVLVEVLRDTASVLNSSLNLNEVLDRILANIAWVIPHEASAIVFVEETQANAVRLRGWESFGVEQSEASLPLDPRERRLLDRMAHSGTPLVIHDTHTDAQWTIRNPNLSWVRSFAAAPLFDEERSLGVLALFSSRRAYFSPIHVQLLEGFAHHASTATRNARVFESVLKSRGELKSLAARAVAAQEEERRRISQELHDEIGQALTAIIVNSEVLREGLSDSTDDAWHKRLAETAHLARDTLRQIRGLSLRLRPSLLDDLGLEPAIRWLSGQFSERMGIAVTCHFTDLEDVRLNTELETTLYRIVQESLTNTAKHAEAHEIQLRVERAPDRITLEIEDDGRGFPEPTQGPPPVYASGLGLLGMRERVDSLDGFLSVDSQPGAGCRVQVEIPIPRP